MWAFVWKIYSFECQEETKLTEIKRKGVLSVDWTEYQPLDLFM